MQQAHAATQPMGAIGDTHIQGLTGNGVTSANPTQLAHVGLHKVQPLQRLRKGLITA